MLDEEPSAANRFHQMAKDQIAWIEKLKFWGLERKLRESFEFSGTPLVLVPRSRGEEKN